MMATPFATATLVLAVVLIEAGSGTAADPLALHAENPRYFRFRGQPEFLITSGEHYGALMNRDFKDRLNDFVSAASERGITPPDVIALNATLNKAIGDDETGFLGTADRVYRSEAWEFLLAGGSTFSNLDYSFTVAHPDGSGAVEHPTPGGGGPSLRKQLSILRGFLAGFDFVHMVPDPSVIKRGVPEKARAEVLALRGQAYAVYLNSGTKTNLVLDLPAGRYRGVWLNPRTGAVDSSEDIDHTGGEVTLRSPHYDEDIALKIVRSS